MRILILGELRLSNSATLAVFCWMQIRLEPTEALGKRSGCGEDLDAGGVTDAVFWVQVPARR